MAGAECVTKVRTGSRRKKREEVMRIKKQKTHTRTGALHPVRPEPSKNNQRF